MKVLYNTCYGGFGISLLAQQKYKERTGKEHYGASRTDVDLIAVVEELGTKANGEHSELSIAEIPDGARYEIDEYDGAESIEPPRMTWAQAAAEYVTASVT